jgi:FdhE protein
MLWPYARLRRPRNVDLERQVAEVRRRHPESEPWLGLLEAALEEAEDGAAWEGAVPTPPADRPVKAPVLAHTEIAIDRRAARRWVRRLLKVAARSDARGLDAVALLEGALCQDDARIDALAREVGAPPEAFRVVGQMAAVPLLRACARVLSGSLPPTWWEGYCPLCGAWPVLAEYTGLERKRQLRCGRCGTGWPLPALRCVFCDETNHDQLGYLAPEEEEQMRKIEVCRTCNGYLKALTTVRALAPWAIPLDDLTTVHLDVVALERGYQRPERAGYALGARIA